MSKASEQQKPERRMTQAERTALSDKRMFQAAIELINERGTQKTTLKDIGETAGYSRGLANYRFGSKDGMMLEMFHHFDGVWKEHLQGYLGDAKGLAAMRLAASALRDFLKEESSYMRAMYLLWYETLGHDSEMRTVLANHHDVYRQGAQRWIEQGIESGEIKPSIDPAQFAVQYCAFVFGLVYQWLVNADSLDLDAVFKSYIELTTNTLSNPDYQREDA